MNPSQILSWGQRWEEVEGEKIKTLKEDGDLRTKVTSLTHSLYSAESNFIALIGCIQLLSPAIQA